MSYTRFSTADPQGTMEEDSLGSWVPLADAERLARQAEVMLKLLAACKAMLCAMSTDDHRKATWMIMKAVQEAEGGQR
jgi:hypothetical protein